MDKVKRMIHKAKQIQKNNPDKQYIAYATVCPRGGEFEATIMYYHHKAEEQDKGKEVIPHFKTRDEAADYVDALAKEHGQNDVRIIHFNF